LGGHRPSKKLKVGPPERLSGGEQLQIRDFYFLAMSWTTLSIHTPEELQDAIVAEFSCDGILGVWERALPHSGFVELVLYFDPAHIPSRVEDRIGRLFERNDYLVPQMTWDTQAQVDWIREWRKSYTRFSVGRLFEVVPSWESSRGSGEDRIQLEIDPGLAFGTGTHETTQLMLELLENQDPAEDGLCDIGTGSGILTIAAFKLGFRVDVACDLDLDAIRVATQNLYRNGVPVSVFLGSVDALATSSMRLLLANLTSESILGALPEISRVLKRNGHALLSGLLESQVPMLRERLRSAGFSIENETQRGEWMALDVVCDGS
jgi:ribosomal protein L11 methyltransferase